MTDDYIDRHRTYRFTFTIRTPDYRKYIETKTNITGHVGSYIDDRVLLWMLNLPPCEMSVPSIYGDSQTIEVVMLVDDIEEKVHDEFVKLINLYCTTRYLPDVRSEVIYPPPEDND